MQFGEAHDKLAALDPADAYVLEDRAAIGLFCRPEIYPVGLVQPRMGRGIIGMRRVRHQVEHGGRLCRIAGKRHNPAAPSNIDALARSNLISRPIDRDRAGLAQVDHPGLAAFAEEIARHLFAAFQRQGFVQRHNAADNRAVHIGVEELRPSGLEQIGHKESRREARQMSFAGTNPGQQLELSSYLIS